MGFYLNNKSKVSLYKSEMQRPYFVDKTLILSELFPLIESEIPISVLQDQGVLERQ